MNLRIGQIRQLAPHPTQINPLGGAATIRNIHQLSSGTLVEVTGLVPVPVEKREPGGPEVLDITWLVDSNRIQP